jgi:hypothetical protein
MRIASGSAVFFASTLAAASATPQTPIAPSLPFRGDLLAKGRVGPSSRRVSYGSSLFLHDKPVADCSFTAHLFPLGSESPQCYQPKPIAQNLITASAASTDFTDTVVEALSKTVSIVSKFKKSQRSPVKANTPSAPPNTPIIPCSGLGLGLSIMDPILGEISIDSSFCYNDNSISQSGSPKLSYPLPSNPTPVIEHSPSLSEELSEALEKFAQSDSYWSSNDLIRPFLQPPNTPVNRSKSLAQSLLARPLAGPELDLEEMDISDMNITEMGDPQFPLIPVLQDLAPTPKLQPFYLQAQEINSQPSTYYHNRKNTTWISLFPSTVLQKSLSSRQLAYLDVCLRYFDSPL